MVIHWSAYLFVYICITFGMWEFKNPFQWVIDLPTWRVDMRVGVLLGLIGWFAFIRVIAKDINKKEIKR